MRWALMFSLFLALVGCKRGRLNGFAIPVGYEASGYGAHSPVKATIEYLEVDGDTIKMGVDPDWIDLPWNYWDGIGPAARPTLYLYVRTIEDGDSVAAMIFVGGTLVAQDSGTVVTLTYHP